MGPTWGTLFILFVMFGFYFSWTRYCRKADLVQNLVAVLQEMKLDKYEVTVEEHEGTQLLELRNPTTRIQYKRLVSDEILVCSRFFANKEASGSNTAIVSRPIDSMGNLNRIQFLRTNALMGKMLYYQGGGNSRKNHSSFI
ncbi:MAG: hypothetical protein UY04_C0005G0007 [Parcubacteria group bacterium GW2011_GWA2_47_7]|nr:MAG: hypothetical protein UY04_C0005G0007 [Parcubacteria group bacterium GW2011_GWA2_47_7]